MVETPGAAGYFTRYGAFLGDRFATLRSSPFAREFVRFAGSTATSAALTVGLPILFHDIVGMGASRAILLAFIIAFACNFAMMRFFVFARGGHAVHDLTRYAISNLSFRAAEYLFILLLTVRAHVYYVAALISVLVASTLIKFWVYRFLVFRAKATPVDYAATIVDNPIKTMTGAVAFLLCVAILILPAIVNGHAILFPDSIGYYASGEALYAPIRAFLLGPQSSALEPGQIYGARSLYYGFPALLSYRLLGEWAVPLLQSILATAVMLLAFRRLGVPPIWTMAFTLTIAAISGMGFFTSAVMPDIFAGYMILGAAIVIGQWRALSTGEKGFWLALTTYGLLVHKGHMPVLAAVIIVMGAFLFVRNRRAVAPFAALAGALVLAALGHKAVDVGTRLATGQPPVSYPFLLARIVGDGTAKAYLDTECGRTAYVLCPYRDRLTMSENEFLWSLDPKIGFYRLLRPDQKARLDQEAGAIVRGAIVSEPRLQLARTLYLMARMNINVGITRYGVTPALSAETGSRALIRTYDNSPILTGQIPLIPISRWMRAVYLLGYAIVGGLVLIVPARMLATDDAAVIRQAIMVGVIANACVFGAISSSADRYQGRVAWLVPMVALASLWSVVARRRARVRERQPCPA